MAVRHRCCFGGGVALIAMITAASVASIGRDGPAAAADDVSFATVAAEVRDLSRSHSIDGVVGHGDTTRLPLVGEGVVTVLPAVGDRIEPGHQLIEVAGVPVLLLQGERPMWRSLGPGASRGVDVHQLETALVAMGFAEADELTVDDRWTSATTAAVKAMQRINGMTVDGRVDLGDVVYATSAVHIAVVEGHLGDAVAGVAIDVTTSDAVIDAALAAADSDLASVGATVEIELPSGQTVDGTIHAIGAPATDADGQVMIPLTISAPGIAEVDGLPVDIDITVVEAADALAVPAEALLALAEGGYAVEVPDDSAVSGSRLVAVDVGVFADGWVAVDGELSAGDEVVVP